MKSEFCTTLKKRKPWIDSGQPRQHWSRNSIFTQKKFCAKIKAN